MKRSILLLFVLLAPLALKAQATQAPINTLPKVCGYLNGGLSVYCPSGFSDAGGQPLYNGQPIGGSSSQVNNVLSYGAATGTTDNTAAFNAAIAACPSSTCTVFIPPGTFALKTSGFAINAPDINLQCAPGAILQAQTGYPTTGAPMLDVGSSARNVIVSNCAWDGNSIAKRAIDVDGAAANVTIDQNEIKNVSSQYGILGNLRTSGPLRITNNYIHSLGAGAAGFYDLAGQGGTPTVNLDNNVFDTLTGNGAGASGDSMFEASNNRFTNINLNDGSLYAYGIDGVDWQHNYFATDGVALHCDTCGHGNISYNTSNGSTSTSMVDMFIVASSNILAEGNVSQNDTGNGGILVGSGNSGQGPATYRTPVLTFENTTGYTAGTNVTLTTNTSTPKVGVGSMIVTTNASFTTGVLWYFNFGTPYLPIWGYQDMWIMPTSGGILSPKLELVCSLNTNLSTQDMIVPIPSQVNGVWYSLAQYQNGWQGSTNQNNGGTGFQSCGMVATATLASTVFQVDQYQYAAEMVGNKLIHNSVINPKFFGVGVGATQQALVEGSYVEAPGQQSGNQSAYMFQNSPGTIFDDNVANIALGSFNETGLATVDTAAQATTFVSNFTALNYTTLFGTPADIFGPVSAPVSFSAPTITGCGTISAQTGSNYAGAFATTTAGTCAAHLAEPAAPHGWNCNVQDVTQHTALTQSATSTTSCTVTGTTVASDVLSFAATPY